MENNLNEASGTGKTSGGAKYLTPVLIGVVVVGLGGYLYFSRKDISTSGLMAKSGNSTGTIETGKITNAGTNTPTDTTSDIVIVGSNYSFSPSVFTVKAGEKVKLTFESANGFHDLVFETLDVKTKQIMGGQSETLEFTAPQTKGEYVFYCSVANHRAMGMVGKMIVE